MPLPGLSYLIKIITVIGLLILSDTDTRARDTDTSDTLILIVMVSRHAILFVIHACTDSDSR